MEYHKKTQELIDRMCRYVERKDFTLKKKLAEEKILKTYDLFNLSHPKKIVWHKDVFDKKFESLASSASSASSARSAWSAWSASSASLASSASSASSARSAWSAWSASSASLASLYWTGLDYDFDWFTFCFEYNLNPDKEFQPNENDKKYLEYCEILIECLELGLGYWAEWEDTLHLVPCPIVRIDELNRFHSTKEPAIKWKGGKELYYLHGVIFDKKWWTKIVKDKMSPEEIFAINNLEYRRSAYEFMDKTKMKKLKDFKILDETTDNYKNPMKVISFTVKGIEEPLKYLNVFCPSTKREYFIGTAEEKCGQAKAKSFGFEELEFTEEW